MCKEYDHTLNYKRSLFDPKSFNLKMALKAVCSSCEAKCSVKKRKREKKDYLMRGRMIDRGAYGKV